MGWVLFKLDQPQPALDFLLKAVEKSTTYHRLRIGWANMVPKIMHEGIGAAEARSYGFEPAPIRLGWPKDPAR